jgi:hypothetical protein
MTSTNLMDANRQWSTRPMEERFTSLTAMQHHLDQLRANSVSRNYESRDLLARPTDDNQGLMLCGPNGNPAAFTNWSFGQVAALAGAPAAYLRTLPAPVAADCLNYGLRVEREAQETGLLLTRRDGAVEVRAATGPRYGRIWSADVVRALADRFGDGVTGDWRVPGIFGRPLEQVSAANTTLYAGDRDAFVFLADEERRVEVANRRDGQPGSLARGFIVSNSEVGAGALRIKCFLFDYVCANRIIWGAQEVQEVAIRHSSGAPRRFVEEAAPLLAQFATASAQPVEARIEAAQAARLERAEQFLAGRFGPRIAERMMAVHEAEEGRPVESAWDAVTAATAYARSVPWTADRVALEEQAGAILDEVRL